MGLPWGGSSDELDYSCLVRFVAKLLSLVPLVAGLGLLWLALARYRLPYENGRYFDPQTQVVYHSQTAEVFLITAIVFIVAGFGIAGVAFRFRHARERSAKS
jgi:hypothetical protein